MTDPARWSEAGDAATGVEQMLVRSGQEFSMPDAEKQAVWSQVVAALPPAVDLPAAAKAPLATKAGSWAALKGLKVLCLLAAASGLTVGGYHWLYQSNAVRATAPKLAAVSSDVSVPSAFVVSTETVPIPSASVVAEPTPSAAPLVAPNRTSSLREESLAVMAARQALRSNDAASALRLLEQAQARFKKGALTEERESLTIEALAMSGQKTSASARARAFLTRYPRSPHAADVQRYLSE